MMKRIYLLSVFMVLLLLSVACTADTAGQQTPSGGVVAASECPVATADSQLYRNESDGYCLLIPATFTAEETAPGNVVVYFGSLMNVQQPKLFINVAEADERPLGTVVEAMLADWDGFDIEHTSGLLLGGEAAEVLGNMPGQDLNRQVISIHNGRLYTLTFVPDDAEAGNVYQEMEALYELAVESFSFGQR